jgi:hypothetical protein
MPMSSPQGRIACNSYTVFPGFIHNIEVAIFAKQVVYVRAGILIQFYIACV